MNWWFHQLRTSAHAYHIERPAAGHAVGADLNSQPVAAALEGERPMTSCDYPNEVARLADEHPQGAKGPLSFPLRRSVLVPAALRASKAFRPVEGVDRLVYLPLPAQGGSRPSCHAPLHAPVPLLRPIFRAPRRHPPRGTALSSGSQSFRVPRIACSWRTRTRPQPSCQSRNREGRRKEHRRIRCTGGSTLQ
jgi:hypothetical protein